MSPSKLRLTYAALLLILLACHGEKRFERTGPFRPGTFKVHVAQNDAEAGLVRTPVPVDGSTVYMHPEPELTEAHLRKIAVSRGRGEDRILALTFTEDGKARLARVTQAHVGKRLVFVIGDRVLFAPVITSVITEGEAIIEGNYTAAQAEQLASQLSGT